MQGKLLDFSASMSWIWKPLTKDEMWGNTPPPPPSHYPQIFHFLNKFLFYSANKWIVRQLNIHFCAPSTLAMPCAKFDCGDNNATVRRVCGPSLYSIRCTHIQLAAQPVCVVAKADIGNSLHFTARTTIIGASAFCHPILRSVFTNHSCNRAIFASGASLRFNWFKHCSTWVAYLSKFGFCVCNSFIFNAKRLDISTNIKCFVLSFFVVS